MRPRKSLTIAPPPPTPLSLSPRRRPRTVAKAELCFVDSCLIPEALSARFLTRLPSPITTGIRRVLIRGDLAAIFWPEDGPVLRTARVEGC